MSGSVRRLLRTPGWPLHLAGLSLLAIAQPLLDLLGSNPEFFVAHHTSRNGILILLAALLLGVPVVLIAGVALARLAGRRARDGALWTIVGLLAAVFTLPLLKRVGLHSSALTFTSAALIGLGAAILYARSAAARSFATIVSVFACAVPVVFLARPGIRTLVFAGELRGALAVLDPSRPTVVLFVFDETPLVSLLDERREIDSVLYPNLSALATDKDGAWFRNATASAEYTRWALPAILDGRYPEADSIPTSGDHPDTLFTLLGRTHRIESFEAVTDLCPESLCPQTAEPLRDRLAAVGDDLRIVLLELFLPDDLTRDLPDLTAGWGNFGSMSPDGEAETPDAAADWRTRWRAFDERDKTEMMRDFIDGIGSDDPRPTFYFMHTLATHHPYLVLPDGRVSSTRLGIPGQRRDGTWSHDEWEIAQNYQRHLMALEYIDTLVGRTVKRLKDARLFDNTLMIITADHGIVFEPGKYLRELRAPTAPELVRVPLIVKWPSGTAAGRRAPRGVIDRNAESIDLVPTIAAVTGSEVTWQVDGASLADSSIPERPGKVVHLDDARRTMTFGRTGPGYAAVLDRKLRLFGSHGNKYRIPRSPEYASMIDTPVAAYAVREDARILIVKRWLYQQVDVHARRFPFDINGSVLEPKPNGEPIYVAVALNGTIRAVTRTWTSQPGGFDATPNPQEWQKKSNVLEAFVVTGPESAPVLHASRGALTGVRDLNVIAPAAWPYGVALRGFYRPEGEGAEAFRWTRGRGSVTVPVDPTRPPRAVRVELSRGLGKRLRIKADACTLFDARVPRGEWRATLSLAKCARSGAAMTISFESAAARARRGSRPLGVAVRSVVLEY